MDFGPDSIPYSELGFISQNKKVFSPDEVYFPDDKCNTVAVAPRYGLVFCSNGNVIKVFQSQVLLSDGEPPPLTTIDTGHPVSHLSTSCDGLTLLVVILQEDKPKAVFYEIRTLVPGCESPSPFAVSALGGARVQAIAWNPMDPCSVAVASTPEELAILSLKDDKIETNSKGIKARALSWSPKGKQLTVGLADGSLALFKPDLQLVRTVKNPPMEEASAVQSITWFTNTEFFIGYKIESEEGGQVFMYVNAPKAQEPKFLVYEFICNENEGPSPAMFYQVFLQEWSTLCLASSRASQLGVLGQGQEGWCEFELEEGSKADMHNVNITEATFPMGMAIDFTSQKTFTHKVTGKVSGPSPVLYLMSTGGEVNIFHFVNNRPSVESLVTPAESLPKIGHRTADQYKGSANAVLSLAKPAAIPVLSTKSPFMSPSPGAMTLGGKVEPSKSVPPNDGASSLFGGSFFAGAAQPNPLLPKFTTQAPLTAGIASGMSLGKSSPIQFNTAFKTTPLPSTGLFTQTQDNKENQKLQVAPGVVEVKLGAATPVVSTPTKSQVPSPIPSSPLPKSIESQASSKSPSPLTTIHPTPVKEKDIGDKVILNVISSVLSKFEEELGKHNDMDSSLEIGTREEMGSLRRSLEEEGSWIAQMSSTTSELFGEITQLHSEVLQGFKLREEADAQINKSKNPRHFSSLQSRQLDPHSRRTVEEIRSKYQYLQSQLEEVNTRLHLDWVNYTNARKTRKKRDLPISETVYNALMKCHTLRTRQERELELLCERLKVVEIDSLSRGLRVNRQHNNDDALASLEKSLSEVKVSPSAYVSPVKMLPHGKQQKLQKILSQRNTIPVRKCATVPKTQLTDLSSFYSMSSPNNQDNGSPFQGPPSFSINTETSFGPQTFSTPNHANKSSVGLDGATPPVAVIKTNNFLSGGKSAISFSPQFKTDQQNKIDTGFTVPDLTLSKSSVTNASSKVNKELGKGLVTLKPVKPVYEDITPPQTPDSKVDAEVKSASPLLALSSLVSKVPTTTATETSISLSISDTRSGFGEVSLPANFGSVASNSIPFSFKPPSSGTTIELVTPKPSLLLSTDTSASANKGENSISLPQFTTSNLSVGQFLASTVTSGQNTSSAALLTTVPTTTPALASSASSLSFSFKGAVPGGASAGGLFIKSPTTISSFAPAGTSSTSSSSSKSSFTVVSSTGSLPGFGGSALGSQLSFSSVSSPSLVVPTSSVSISNIKSTTVETKVLSSTSITSPLTVSKEATERSTSTPVKETTPVSSSTLAGTVAEQSSVANSGFGADNSLISKLLTSSSAASPTGLFASVKSPAVADKPPALEPSGGSLFGSVLSTSGTSTTTNTLFSSPTSSASGSLFGATSSTASGMFSATTASSSSMFKGPETSSSSNSSVFGGSTITSGSMFGTTKPAESGGLFGTAKTESGSLFGGAKTTEGGSLFGTTKTSESGSIFGTAKGTESGGIFGTAKTTESNTMFGTSSSGGSIFGGGTLPAGSTLGSKLTTPVKSTTEVSLSTPTTTVASSLASTATSPSSGGGLFGGSAAATSSGGSVFGGVLSPTSTSGTMFSSPGASSAGTTFGSSGTTSASLTFGSSSTSSAGTFGQPSAFGGLSTSSAFGSLDTTTTVSGFALNAPATTSAGGPIFGQKSESVFGQTSQSSAPSIFGGPSTTASVFGGTTQNQGGSVFGSSVPQSGGSMFGGGSSTQPSGTSIFGGSVTSTSGNSMGFGQAAPAATSPFASASTTAQETSSPFSSSGFGMGTSNGGGGGGGFFSGLGSKPSEENANKNIFGSTSFTAAKPQLGLFGGGAQGTPSTFGAAAPSTSSFGAGQTSTSSTFGSPGFGGAASAAGSGGDASQSAFGMTTPQKSPGFGSNATFGGAAVFGGTPSFNSPPKFGQSSPAFGGGAGGGFSGFGTSGNASTFGAVSSAPPSSTAFAGYSGQSNAATFGSVAQQSPPPQPPSFGNTGSPFGGSGGSSFSTWR